MRSGGAGTDRRALLPCRRSGKQQRRLDGKKARLDPDRQHRADCSPPTGPDPGRPLYGDRTARLVGEDRRSRRSDLRIPVLPRYRSPHHDDRPRCGGARTRAITDWGDARKTANRNRKTRPNSFGEKKSVLYLAHPNWTAGSGTTLHEVISYAGFRNAATEHGFAGHGKISIEKILSINLDAILIGTSYNRDEGFRDRLLGDPLFTPLDAVRRRRIVALPSRQLTAVSHHLADCVIALRDVMAEISIAKTGQAPHKNNHGRIRK